ncbi:MAG: type IV toxin-antitoxin system AbiEi family antitoxin domain-containing protein [Candidatus Sulfotelmatobacter sp.]
MVRPRDIEAIGLPREYLVRLHRQGKLNRFGRGIYTLPDAKVTCAAFRNSRAIA